MTAARITRRRAIQAAAAAGAAFGLAGLRPAHAQPGIVRAVLPNSLLVLVEERTTANTAAVQLSVRAGARDDGPQPGVTLITSRMLFQGTPRRPSETALQREAALVGGTLARGTSLEWSIYNSVVPYNEVALALDLISDVVSNPLFDEDALRRQQQIALQEIARRQADPNVLINDLFQVEMFAGHPTGTFITGTSESVSALAREDLLQNRARLWGASNSVLSVVGRVNADDVLALARGFFGEGFPTGTPNVRPWAPQSIPDAPRAVLAAAGQQQAQFRLAFPAPGLLDEDRNAMSVLNAVLGGSSGRLFREVRSERGLAYTASSGYTSYTDAGAFFATAGVDPQNLQPAIDVVRTELQAVRDQSLEPAEAAERIGQLAGRTILEGETNAARAGRLSLQELLGTESTEAFIARLRQVTAADVQRVAQTYLVPERALLLTVGPT